MGRTLAAFAVGGVGLFMSMAGQALWRQSPDEIWAACAVVGVLAGAAIAFEARISRVLDRFMRT